MLTLDVLIATHTPAGIKRVEAMNLPVIDGVRYIVSWQQHENAPIPEALTERGDVDVHRLEKRGLGNNRNNAIENSTADIRLIADDDLVYTPEGLQAVRQVFDNDPTLDYASFMFDGECCKTYPDKECDLKRIPKGFYQSAIEIAFRNRGLSSQLRFHPEFGLGSNNLHAGEDEMFLLTARKLNLKCRFFPIVITTHHGLTTGRRRITNPRSLRGTGAFIYFCYPQSFLLRIPLKAWRLSRAGQSGFFVALFQMLRGVVYAITHVKPQWKEEGRR